MKSNLQKNIMRRVYYSYALRFVSEPMLWQGFVLGACVALFGRLTHVAAIAHNFGSVSVENAPSYVWHSVTHALVSGETFTVLVVFAMVALSVKFCLQLLALFARMPKMQMA